MFKWYGLAGILLIIFTEINFFLKIEPFASWYFPIIWLGYILVVDALIYKLKGSSLLVSRPKEAVLVFIGSFAFWNLFEILNLFTMNWYYNVEFSMPARLISAAFIFSALYETYLLFRAVHLFDDVKLKKSRKIGKNFLYAMIFLGIVCLIAPIMLEKYAFPLLWVSFFFFLDPINYVHKQPSIIGHFKDRKMAVPLCLLLAGIIMGILWEFWNYWAVAKWFYEVPFIGFFKIFEMPLLGYIGYFPFAFELYSMYWFTRSLFMKKEKLIAD